MSQVLLAITTIGITTVGVLAQSSSPGRTPPFSFGSNTGAWDVAMRDLGRDPAGFLSNSAFTFGLFSMNGPAYLTGALALTPQTLPVLSPVRPANAAAVSPAASLAATGVSVRPTAATGEFSSIGGATISFSTSLSPAPVQGDVSVPATRPAADAGTNVVTSTGRPPGGVPPPVNPPRPPNNRPILSNQ